MTIRHSLVAAVAMIAAATTAGAAEFYTDEPVVSPDGSSKITLRYGERSIGTEWHITLSRNGHVLYRRLIRDERDVRYVNVSWSPSSRAVLLGEGYHGGMDLTLLRMAGRRGSLNHFDLDDRVVAKEDKELPLRRELQSSASASRVAWSTVKWPSATRCAMLYIIHGFGYEGEGDVTVDFSRKRPGVRISHLRALAHPEYFNAD